MRDHSIGLSGSGNYFVFVYYNCFLSFRMSTLFELSLIAIKWGFLEQIHNNSVYTIIVYSLAILGSLCMIHRDTGWGAISKLND